MKVKKILFVIPSYSNEVLDKHTKTNVMPYGVLSLVSYIEHYFPEIICKILDLNIVDDVRKSQEVLSEEVRSFRPDMIGLSLMYNSCLRYVAEFADIVKKYCPNAFLFAGGIMATNLIQDVFERTPEIDAICHAEGELPIRDLIESSDWTKTLDEHPSWITYDGLNKGKITQPKFVMDLDDIPIINYSHVDLTAYSSRIKDKDGIDRFTLPIHSTRGCPYKCVFCCSAANHGRKIRYMSAERFLQDVRTMVDQYGIEKLSIDDDQFLFNKKRTVEILKGLAELNIEIEMANGLSVKFIDDEIARLLKAAGLKIAVLAVESGSENVLKNIIHKPLKVSEIKPAVDALKKHDLTIHTFFMIGLPGEQEEDRKQTRDMMIDIGFDWNGIAIATPFKGSELYDICIENNYLLKNDLSDLDVYSCYIKAPGVDPEKITKEAYLLNLDVNFVNNYNYRVGNYEKARQYFQKIVDRYPFHAFAYYCLAKTLEKMEGSDINYIKELYDSFNEKINADVEWRQHAEHFGII